MKKIFTGVFLFVWIAAGLSFSWFFYQNQVSISIGSLQKRIVQMEIGTRNSNQLIDKLPQIFTEFPSTCAILILNQKTKLLGSLYEPSRVSKLDYEKLIRTYNTIEMKNFQYFRLPFSTGYSAWVISKKDLNPATVFGFIFENNPKLILIPVAYFFIFVITIMTLFFAPAPIVITNDLKGTLSLGKEIPEYREQNHQQTNRFLANKIILLMDTIENHFSTRNIAFYSRESGIWKHVLEKTGNLTVRGDAAIENLPAEILNLSENTWREPLISHEGRLMFIPLHYRNVLFGLLRLQFSALASDLTSEFLEKLLSLTTRYSHSLFMQRIYDKAVTDPETDYYNYPYFYFMVREKITNSKSFAVVVFEISHLNRISPESTRSWSQELVLNLNKVQLNPLLNARLERTKFAFLYEIGNINGENIDVRRLEKIPEIIKNTTLKSFKGSADVTGGFFIRPTSFEDADLFMQRLDFLLINSTFSPFSSDFNDSDSSTHRYSA